MKTFDCTRDMFLKSEDLAIWLGILGNCDTLGGETLITNAVGAWSENFFSCSLTGSSSTEADTFKDVQSQGCVKQ